MNTNTLVLIGVAILLIIGAVGFYVTQQPVAEINIPPTIEVTTDEVATSTNETEEISQTPEPNDTKRPVETIIGESVSGASIAAYHFGTGFNEILFVGGLHGGYSYNTTLVAYEVIDSLRANPDRIPENLRVTIIPVVNPDGLNETVGSTGRFIASTVSTNETNRIAGRFNINEVDLNRNFDCEWSESGVWQTRTVSGGSAPESEPEAAALANYVRTNNPIAAVVWFGAEGQVYPSACGSAPSQNSVELAAVYATAAGYSAAAEFDAYAITGDFVNWLTKENIPAISVLLTDHTNPEWSKNQAGVMAVMNHYAR